MDAEEDFNKIVRGADEAISKIKIFILKKIDNLY